MSGDTKTNFSERLQKIIDEDILIERVKNKSKVPKAVVRQIVGEVGVSLPKIYDKLYKLGYAVPITEFQNKVDKEANRES